ncbi:MAG TPA: nickel-binding protein, partial [Polyangia bacterium]
SHDPERTRAPSCRRRAGAEEELTMAKIIVETTFDPPISEAEFDAMADRVMPCLDERAATWVTSYFATDRRRRVCVFEANDAESVRQAYRMSGVKFDRVWAADQITDDDE